MFVLLIRDVTENGWQYGVVTKENGCPIFTESEALAEMEDDPMHPDTEYKMVSIVDAFGD